jgi:hypothetical protein
MTAFVVITVSALELPSIKAILHTVMLTRLDYFETDIQCGT